MASAAEPQTSNLLTFNVPRHIDASPEEIFAAWAEPDLFEQWFEMHRAILRKAAPDELWYWVADCSGRKWAHYCRYLRVEKPWLLEFAWVSECTRGLESIVTIELKASRGGTDMLLTHSGIPDDELGRDHEQGWTELVGVLAEKIRGLRR